MEIVDPVMSPRCVASLVAKFGQLLLRLGVARRLLGLGELSAGSLLAFIVGGTLDLSSLFESVGYILASLIVEKSSRSNSAQGLSTYLATTSWYFQPTSCARRPTVQYFRPGFNLRTRSA